LNTSDLTKMTGVHNVVNNNDLTTFSVDTDQIPTVMTYLSSKEILSLQATPPTLEDLFMRYYNRDQGGIDDEKS
jgi:hypothetical protein